MPTYIVTLRVNIPGLGERSVVQDAVNAQTLVEAITEAMRGVIIEPIHVEIKKP